MDVGVNYEGTLFICETSWMWGLIMMEHCLFVRLHGCGVNYEGALFICETSWMWGLIMKEHCLFVRLHGCGG